MNHHSFLSFSFIGCIGSRVPCPRLLVAPSSATASRTVGEVFYQSRYSDFVLWLLRRPVAEVSDMMLAFVDAKVMLRLLEFMCPACF